MDELAELGSPAAVRTALAVVVALLLLATCIKWLRLRSPDGEHWAWLLLVVQGAMFASLTAYSPSDWLPRAGPMPQPAPAAVAPVSGDAPPSDVRAAPKTVPLRLEVPQRSFDRRPVEASLERGRRHGQLARLP